MVQDDKRDLEQRDTANAFERRVTDLDRVEMLAVALDAFAQPVPDYEPRLHPRVAKLLQRSKS